MRSCTFLCTRPELKGTPAVSCSGHGVSSSYCLITLMYFSINIMTNTIGLCWVLLKKLNNDQPGPRQIHTCCERGGRVLLIFATPWSWNNKDFFWANESDKQRLIYFWYIGLYTHYIIRVLADFVLFVDFCLSTIRLFRWL